MLRKGQRRIHSRERWQLGATIDFSKDCYTRQENFLGAELSSVTNITHLRHVEIVDLFMTSLLLLRHSNVFSANLLSIERHQWRKKHSDSLPDSSASDFQVALSSCLLPLLGCKTCTSVHKVFISLLANV
jgi:hypothetical protein